MIDVQGTSLEAARAAVLELALEDLARAGHTDVLEFKIVPGQITRDLSNEGDEDEEVAPRKPRPSGWHRS